MMAEDEDDDALDIAEDDFDEEFDPVEEQSRISSLAGTNFFEGECLIFLSKKLKPTQSA